MVAVNSEMLALGTDAPDFNLPSTDGNNVAWADVRGEKGTLVMFICNHCPYVIHIADGLAALDRDYAGKGVGMVAISANDVDKYPADNLEAMKAERASRGYTFPYLLDESQAVAKSYRAACTPDFYLFDAAGKLAYRGQFDASRPGNDIPVTGSDLRAAMDAVMAGEPPIAEQIPSIGCNIKWKPGNAPEYFPQS